MGGRVVWAQLDGPPVFGFRLRPVPVFLQGVSKLGEILDLGAKAGIVEKSGSWFSYDSIRIGQGRENAKSYLKDNPEVAEKIERAIRGHTDQVADALMVGPDAEDDI